MTKINLAKSAGFCLGVKRAIAIAEETAKTKEDVVMLGDIVHNEEVVRQIQKAGIKKINRLNKGSGKTLLIRAHGCSKEILNRALKSGYEVIDATCPMVKEIHKIASGLEKQGYRIIVIGDKLHDEVQGIIGQLKSKALVIDSLENIPLKALKKIKKAAVVTQSTQNLDNVIKIVHALRRNIPQLIFRNTICNPTRTKQDEVKTMPAKNDIMIIIGSKTSANTKRIYEISRSLNKKSYWINSGREIRKSWLKGVSNIGLTAGASTPQSTIDKVIRRINSCLLP